jgi:hypothetical protein
VDIPQWVPWLITALVLAFLEWRRRRKTPAPSPALEIQERVVDLETNADSPVSFGRKNLWIAVPASNSEHVAQVLGLADVQPANWRSGFLAAYAHPSSYVFITPPIRGWVLAVGSGIPDPSDPAILQNWRSAMAALSQAFGRAQFFASHRGSSYSAWARYSGGGEERLFAWADEPIHDLGSPLPEEREVLARLPDPVAADEDPDYWSREDLRGPDEDDVFGIAAAWSVDPSTFDESAKSTALGLVGKNPSAHPRPAA